jgi:HEAT repeat protein
MMMRFVLGTLLLSFNAFAGDFTSSATENALNAAQSQPELADWIQTMSPVRNRAGFFYFPTKNLVQPEAQALVLERLLRAEDDSAVRVALAYALDGSLLIPWEKIAAESDAKVRVAMIHLTKIHKGPDSSGLLVNALQDSSTEVRAEAARLAGYVQFSPNLTTALKAHLSDAAPNVRALAARSLGWQANPEYFEAIRPLLNDPEAAVRNRALQALANIDPVKTRAMPELANLQNDSHAPLAKRAKRLAEK